MNNHELYIITKAMSDELYMEDRIAALRDDTKPMDRETPEYRQALAEIKEA